MYHALGSVGIRWRQNDMQEINLQSQTHIHKILMHK